MVRVAQPKSAWSGPDRRRVEAFESAGLMHASGQAKVDEARRHGLWAAGMAKPR